jgi:polysaccharide export outer membrane protein
LASLRLLHSNGSTMENRAAVGVVLAVFLSGCGASLNSGTQSTFSPAPQNDSMGLSTSQTKPAVPIPTSSASALSVSEVAAQLTAVSDPASSSYQIGPMDVLDVSVFNVPELSKTVQVAGTGSVNLPLVGEIPAAGKTAQEVEHDLAKRLGAKYLQNPQVTVFVKEHNSQRVTVEGAVKKPGVYPLQGRTSLLQSIATAEGQTESAESDVLIFRQTGGKRMAARFDLDDIRAGKSDDPNIQAGDVIVVNTSTTKLVYQNIWKYLGPVAVFASVL